MNVSNSPSRLQRRARSALWFLVVFFAAPEWMHASPPVDGSSTVSRDAEWRLRKRIDAPNPIDRARIQRRLDALRTDRQARLAHSGGAALGPGVELHGKSGTDRVLVILVEFAGTDTFEWTPGKSTWDPLGRCDHSELDGDQDIENVKASLFFARKYGITGVTNLTYSGPLHNQIPRPTATNDPSAAMVWVPDFSPAHYSNLIGGDGIVFDYAREDGSAVLEDFTGKSVRDYYEDMSGGAYTFSGTVLGWVQVPHSVWYYGGDGLPGARSCSLRPDDHGAIPGAGDARSLVVDALKSAQAAYPGFDWASLDSDKDGQIDRLWIIHAGLGEEDQPTVLNRTRYGEGGIWSHSWSLSPPYEVAAGVWAGSYIMMPENAGIAVLAHEFGHNLGAMDLYTYGDGQTSAGFWTLMSDSWVGYPLGFLPEAMDPMHLDGWGWLQPSIIRDPTRVYALNLGQASRFPAAPSQVRAVKIELPDFPIPLPVQPRGQFQWWGGARVSTDSSMTLEKSLHIPVAGATLEFQTAYNTEQDFDFFHVEISANGGISWQNLMRSSGQSLQFPHYVKRTVSLAAYVNKDVLLRFRYATDDSYSSAGPFVDEVVVRSDTTVLLSDDAEEETGLWKYTAPWSRNQGFSDAGDAHNYYLQWRNTSASGGYDQALGDPRYRFGPVNGGLIVWYQDDRYFDNRISDHLLDDPSFGPKGKLLVVDAHPEPYPDPYWVAHGVLNEQGMVFSRCSMRDAPFSRLPSIGFHLSPPYAFEETDFAGRPAVPLFSDARGYSPGIENTAPGLWRTRQWDVSVALPATASYGVRGPGYPAGTPLETIIATRSFLGTQELILYRTNLIAEGLATAGADGNPGTLDHQHGWNVRIVRQTDAEADVVIWNSRHANRDDDRDGFPNWQEAIAGTDPADPTSLLRITRAEYGREEPGLVLSWGSVSNRVYRLLRSTDVSVPFEAVAADIPAMPPTNTVRDPSPPPAGPPVLYRIEVQ